MGDAGLDDQKIIRQVDHADSESLIRATHNRLVAVYNDRLDRWEEELLDDLTSTVPFSLLPRPWLSLLCIPFPKQKELAGNHQNHRKLQPLGRVDRHGLHRPPALR